MANDLPNQPFIYEGVEPISGKENEGRTLTEKITRAAQDVGNAVGNAYDKAREPGMPLSVLSNIAREAPLGSLFAAFLLGMFVARRW